MAERTATIKRDTLETRIEVSLNLDGTGQWELDTGIGFFDHMLSHIAAHGLIDLKLRAAGDLEDPVQVEAGVTEEPQRQRG
mgnify:CR=1 FL=1